MKIKRIFAKDMRQAIRQVRDEHGPEAVILSSKTVTGGVEVISAIDFDQETMEAELAGSTGAGRESPACRGDADSTDFAHLLRRTAAHPPSGRSAGVSGSGFSVTVDDSCEEDLERTFTSAIPFADTAGAGGHTDERRARSGRQRDERSALAAVEWTQEPAIQEMRSELKTLRSLFENQLSLMDWQQTGRRHPVRALVLRQLSEMGFGPDVCRKVADRVAEDVSPELALRHALAIITRHLPVGGDALLDEGGVVAVVGATGVGKTTTVAKLAARFTLRHGRQHVALVSTDNFRIGAQDQLRNFARILGVAVHTADSGDELGRVLAELDDRRLVLIDTAGMSQRDLRLAEQFNALRGQKKTVQSYLVLSAGTQLSGLDQTARAFRKVAPSGCILTKVDEATSLGPALTVMLRHRLPAAFLGVGQRVPEDLQPARGDRLVQHAVRVVRESGGEVDDEQLAMAFGGA